MSRRERDHEEEPRLRMRRILLGRDVAIAFGIMSALYLARSVGFLPLQIPAYFMIIVYDVLELAFPSIDPYHAIGFPVFLYLLAVLAGAIARTVRPKRRTIATWRIAAAGVCLVLSATSLGFGAYVGGPLIAVVDNPTPLAITTLTGAVLLVGAWWLLGRPSMPLCPGAAG